MGNLNDDAGALKGLLDERAIVRGLNRFARILDNREWTGIAEVFANDLTFNYGDGGEQRGIEALEAMFRRHLDGCGPSQHLLGSIDVVVDGERALSRAYIQARHQGKGARAHLIFDSNGEYVDSWQWTADGWRITRREARWLMLVGDSSVLSEGEQ